MTHPGWALQKAVYASLAADTALAALVGGDRIHDAPPRAAAMPYVALDPIVTTDIGASLGEIHEHRLTLVVWSAGKGKREALAILERLVALLHDADLALDDHRLVNLRREREEVRVTDDRRAVRGELRLRAVTEPLA